MYCVYSLKNYSYPDTIINPNIKCLHSHSTTKLIPTFIIFLKSKR
jgi:hypothetical protein